MPDPAQDEAVEETVVEDSQFDAIANAIDNDESISSDVFDIQPEEKAEEATETTEETKESTEDAEASKEPEVTPRDQIDGDLYANLPQNVKADLGRIPSVQRQNAELKKELDALKASIEKPTQSAIKTDELNLQDIEDIAPDASTELKTLFTSLQSQLSSQKSQIESLEQVDQQNVLTKEEERRNQEQTIIEKDYPDHHAITQSDNFNAWKLQQPPFMQQAIANISNATDYKHILDSYSSSVKSQKHQAEISEKKEVMEERNESLKESAAPKSQGSTPNESLDDFDYWADELDKKGM